MRLLNMTMMPRDETYGVWARLRQFHNPNFLADYLCAIHKLGASQRQNASKQANQIRYSLLQAKEYYDASRVATLATQPTLLYYCAMHLALAEILFKQSGESSLDRAREQHRHHGLDFRCDGKWRDREALSASAQKLRARPLARGNNERFGTFELWHRSAREAPIGGSLTEIFSDRETTASSFRMILSPSDDALPPLPVNGISFLECLAALPGMEAILQSWGISSNLIRSKVEVSVQGEKNRSECTIIVHPGAKVLHDRFFQNIKFYASAIDRITINEPPSGMIIKWWQDDDNKENIWRMPHGCMSHTEEVKFWPEDQPLNEFGFHYIALFIAGNYARYYPDWWMRDIETSSPLALSVERLIHIASIKLPLLTLSELSKTSFILAAP